MTVSPAARGPGSPAAGSPRVPTSAPRTSHSRTRREAPGSARSPGVRWPAAPDELTPTEASVRILPARLGLIARNNFGSIDFGVVGPKCAGTAKGEARGRTILKGCHPRADPNVASTHARPGDSMGAVTALLRCCGRRSPVPLPSRRSPGQPPAAGSREAQVLTSSPMEGHESFGGRCQESLRETHWKRSPVRLEILGSRDGALAIQFVWSAKSSGASRVRAGYSGQSSGIANALAGHAEGPGRTIVVHVGGVGRRGGRDEDRLLELASDFPLAGGVGAVWNESHAEATRGLDRRGDGLTSQLPETETGR